MGISQGIRHKKACHNLKFPESGFALVIENLLIAVVNYYYQVSQKVPVFDLT